MTLIDSLDMLVIMGNNSEFQRVAQLVLDHTDFDIDINVSVFETNIRGKIIILSDLRRGKTRFLMKCKENYQDSVNTVSLEMLARTTSLH